MSSVTEGLGTSLLDAMACGKPIVATTAGGMPEVVADGETGHPRAAARRTTRMAAAIVTAAQRSTRCDAAMGDGRPAPASASASAPERMVQDTLDVYRASPCTRTWKRNADLKVGPVPRHGLGTRGLEFGLIAIDTPGLAAGVIARAVVEGDRGAVGREGDAARDAARREAVGIDERHAPRLAPVRASNRRSW